MSKKEIQTETAKNEAPKSESTPENSEGTAPSGGGLNISIDSIADNLSSSMPEIQDHAIEQEKINESQALEEYAHLKDKDGKSFNPEIHKTNAKGEPTTTKLGKLILKPAARGTTTAKSSIGGVTPKATPEQDKQAQARISARASGTMAANLLLQFGIVLGGEEWLPRKHEQAGLDEKAMLENAFADYFEATGKTDLPPAMALTVAIGAYSLPRFTMPKTQSRLSKAKTAIKQWWINRKLKKHSLKASPTETTEK